MKSLLMQTSVNLVNIKAIYRRVFLVVFEAGDFNTFNRQVYHQGFIVFMLIGLRPFLHGSLQSCWNGK